MEYMPGTKISAAAALRSAGLDTGLVARRATEAYLLQVLKHSFLHSDPHPGNVMVAPDGELHMFLLSLIIRRKWSVPGL